MSTFTMNVNKLKEVYDGELEMFCQLHCCSCVGNKKQEERKIYCS